MKSNVTNYIILPVVILSLLNCSESKNNLSSMVSLITLNPGHFHAALVQKTNYPNVDSNVYVYGVEGPDLQAHLDRINNYNTREDNPTNWNQIVYKGEDFLSKMIAEKKGNVVVLSGNNQKKIDYITQSLNAGFNVYADKPMVIDYNGFSQLEQAFNTAKTKNILLYDIMTERFEINTILQKELSQIPEIFGILEKGSRENPAITKESVHHFYKYVSGNVLVRPSWFLDSKQQGEGIVDVMTHLVDLVQWECFPEQIIDYKKDIDILDAKRWPTNISNNQFKEVTKWSDSLNMYPDFLTNSVRADKSLDIFCNGEINYSIKGIHAKTSVIWNYKAPEGTGDTHYSIMRGTKSNLVIRQGKEENYKPTLYLEPVNAKEINEETLQKAFTQLNDKYKGITYRKSAKGWIIEIPEALKEGHEAHFARVTENYLKYLNAKALPEWEVPNMLAKYYTTTKALQIANKQ